MRESWLCDGLTCNGCEWTLLAIFFSHIMIRWIEFNLKSNYISFRNFTFNLSSPAWLPLPPPKVGNLRVRHCCTSALQWQVSRDSKHHLFSGRVGSSWISTVRRFEIWNTSHAACCSTWQWNDNFLQNPILVPTIKDFTEHRASFPFPKVEHSCIYCCTLDPTESTPHASPALRGFRATMPRSPRSPWSFEDKLKCSPHMVDYCSRCIPLGRLTSWQLYKERVTWSKEVNAIMNKGTILQTWAQTHDLTIPLGIIYL